MRLPDTYQRCLVIDEQRLVLLSSEEAINIRSIKRGILFILAKWSGASQLAFRAINKALASFRDLDGVYLYIADADSEKVQEFLTDLGDVPAGAGETYWLLEGQVHQKFSGYREESLSVLRDYTQQILPSSGQ